MRDCEQNVICDPKLGAIIAYCSCSLLIEKRFYIHITAALKWTISIFWTIAVEIIINYYSNLA